MTADPDATASPRVWWTGSYRRFLRRVLARLSGGRCQRCRRPGPLCLRVPPAVEVRHPKPDDAEVLCDECCLVRDRETLTGPAVRGRKAADREAGLFHRAALLRWVDDGGPDR